MTSNMGAEIILENFEDLDALGEEHRADIIDTTKEEIFEALKENLRPEFLNRIDDVVTFHSLTEDNLLEITDILLEGVRKNLEEKEIQISFNNSLKKHLIKVGYDKEF